MASSGSKRDPYEGLGDTLSALTQSHATAVQGENPELQGARGQRAKPRYRSETTRAKMTIDIDAEPTVKDVLAAMAENPPPAYGPGPIRLGDWAVAALQLGLLALAEGHDDVQAAWTYASRGARRIEFSEELEEKWWTLVRELKIEP